MHRRTCAVSPETKKPVQWEDITQLGCEIPKVITEKSGLLIVFEQHVVLMINKMFLENIKRPVRTCIFCIFHEMLRWQPHFHNLTYTTHRGNIMCFQGH